MQRITNEFAYKLKFKLNKEKFIWRKIERTKLHRVRKI